MMRLPLAISSVCCALFVLPAPAQATWMAVAINDAAGGWGARLGESKNVASSKALVTCREFSNGADGCEVRLVTRKCIAVSRSGKKLYLAESRSNDKAREASLEACQSAGSSGCEISNAFCASDN